jgi:hypothetical protein
MSYRMKACDLSVGDRVVIPPTLLPTNAVIKDIKSLPARGGSILVASVEFDFGPMKGIKSDYAFRTDDERVEYIPQKGKGFWYYAFLPITFWLY